MDVDEVMFVLFITCCQRERAACHLVNVQDTLVLSRTSAMGIHASTISKSIIRGPGSAPIPGVNVAGDILIAIMSLSEAAAQKRHYPFRTAVQLRKLTC